VNQFYGNVPSASGLQYAIAAVLFTVQLFCDFSGYTDIAMGSARLMGVRLMDNFNRPFLHYQSQCFLGGLAHLAHHLDRRLCLSTLGPQCAAEGLDHHHLHLRAHRFLARAHMELRDVRPVPRGIAMVLQRMYIRIKPLQPFNNSAPMRVFWTVWNSSLIIFSCIFFRNNVTDAFAVIQHIFTDFRLSMADLRSGYFAEMVMGLFFAALAVATTLFPRSMRFKYDNVYVVCMLVVIFAFGSDARNQFIYFQF
jgi:alginate O-acetyltransferase complex protein AlgI